MTKVFALLRRWFAVLILLAAGAAYAAPVSLDLPAQPLSDSILQLSRLAGQVIAVDNALVQGRRAPAVHGTMEPLAALKQLLAGSGLVASVKDGSIVITVNSGGISLGAVKVQGANYAVGPNGSSDVTATEGTGSYAAELATVGSKMPLSLRETPQSVSAVTQQQVQDRDLTDIYSVLNQMPGISLIKTNSLTSEIISRGYQITTFQIDGGAPTITNFSGVGTAFNIITPVFDMGEYDHVEVLRGSDGMWAGVGDPSGAVNLVRKRPLAHDQVVVQGDIGSFDTFRGMIDATGPLAFDGRLRGRIVASGQTEDYFYNIADDRQFMTYGVLEYDLTPSTLLTAGTSLTKVHSIPGSGVPRYSTGADLHLPEDTCLCLLWSRTDVENREYFAKVDQKIGSDWTLSANATIVRNSTYSNGGGVSGTVNVVTLQGPAAGPGSGITGWDRQYALEATLQGKFKVFGIENQLVMGVNWAKNSQQSEELYHVSGTNYTPVNVFDFNPGLYPYVPYSGQVNGPCDSCDLSEPNGTTQLLAFVTLRVSPLKQLHFYAGTTYQAYSYNQTINPENAALAFPLTASDNGTYPAYFVPYAGIVYDLTKNISPYFSYTSIYEPQRELKGPLPSTDPYDPSAYPGQFDCCSSPAMIAYLTDYKDHFIGPLTGAQYELGVKGEFFDKRLYSALSAYYINRFNEAEVDPLYGFIWEELYYYSGIGCCFINGGHTVSRGISAEVNGRILPGVDIAGSYSYDHTVGISRQFTQAPEEIYKLWVNWRLGGDVELPEQRWRRVSLGLGVNGQSSTYYSGSVCPSPTDTNSAGVCTVPAAPYQFTQKSYAVVAARVGYRINSHVDAQVNIENVANLRYYVTPGTSAGGNWYGDPLTVMATVRAKF